MQTWEYKLVEATDFKEPGLFGPFPDRARLEAALNALGREGWEVVNMQFRENLDDTSWVALLKRPAR